MAVEKSNDILCLFDVDGTLTHPRQKIEPQMEKYLQKLRNVVHVALVGGSDLSKIYEQMCGNSGNANKPLEELLEEYDYVFAENGLVSYKGSTLLGKQSIANFLGEEKCQEFINFCLDYMSKLIIPRKRGNFIEFRNGMINVTICGRSVTQAEREEFAAYDQQHHLRKQFVEALEKRFPEEYGLAFVIGGQISIDVFPKGWDKTYCLRWIPDNFKTIHFFGDKTAVGGNDHSIYVHPKTIGHHVNCPDETMSILSDIFGL
ncbi:hypothetical protein B4U80_06428 [Leptotrombidium deliense]|uniref:Phosphomannomutase n=1 Tax=Leptotrombidium deliense TaxID=299467 RepID=A0A443S3T0_9ACAR|nr:hypothetical protein B4U80_06428 [Leptotrombidium deliense]